MCFLKSIIIKFFWTTHKVIEIDWCNVLSAGVFSFFLFCFVFVFPEWEKFIQIEIT